MAQLTCGYGGSHWLPRLTAVLLSMIAAYTAIDSRRFWSGADDPLGDKAVAFCIALAM